MSDLLKIVQKSFEIEGQKFSVAADSYDEEGELAIKLNLPDGGSIVSPLHQFQDEQALNKFLNSQIKGYFKGCLHEE